MDAIGLNSDLVIDGRRFHVQTSLNADTGEVSAMVFEDGRLVERLAQRVPGTVSAQEAKEQVAALHSKASEAVRALFELRQKVRDLHHAPSHNRLGLLFFRRGFLAEARQQFELAIALDGSVAEYHKNLGEVLMAENQPGRAVVCFLRGLEGGQHYPDLYRALARALWALGRRQEALTHLCQALRYNPSYGAALLDLAKMKLETLAGQQRHPDAGEVDEVAALLRRALPHLRGSAEHLRQALYSLRNGQPTRASELIALASEGDDPSPSQVEQELLLRLMLRSSAEDGETIDTLVAELERMSARHAEYADLHNSLGVAYLIQGRNYLLRAARQFKEALRINPRFRTAKRNLRLVENEGRGLLILLRTLLK